MKNNDSVETFVYPVIPGDVGLERIEPARPGKSRWPEPVGRAARIGVAGEVLDAIEPTTEGDPNAILFQLLSSLGCLLGNKPHLMIDEKRHPLKIWVVVVGATASGKKGTGVRRVFSLLDEVDPSWTLRRRHGLTSGEAIVHHVRDNVVRVRRVRKNGQEVETVETVVGEADKRLMLIEEEFSRVPRLSSQEGTTLSAMLREAWESDVLMTTAKTTPEKATGAHVVVIGHITPEELLGELSAAQLSNGFANRFLYALSRRSQRLSRPPPLAPDVKARLIGRLEEVLRYVDNLPEGASELGLSEDSWALWDEMKSEIEEEIEWAEAGNLLLTKVITRGPPYVLRLAALYAILETTPIVEPAHLHAAREIWRYSVDSARVIFGDGAANPNAQKVLEALEKADDSRLRRTDISALFGRHRSAEELDELRDTLLRARRIDAWRRRTRGRPVEWWVLRRAGGSAGEPE